MKKTWEEIIDLAKNNSEEMITSLQNKLETMRTGNVGIIDLVNNKISFRIGVLDVLGAVAENQEYNI